MKNYIYVFIAAFAGAILAVVIGFWLVGNQPAELGAIGITRYPNSAIAARGGYFSTAMPTSVTDGTLTVTGATTLSGATTQSGTFTATSDNRVKSPVYTGASSTLSGTTTTVITAAQACDNSLVTLSASITAASTLTLPTAAAMFADCLTTNGDEVTLYARNLTASTTVITANTSSTINIDSGGTVTLGALGTARITFVRFSDILLWAFVTVFIP